MLKGQIITKRTFLKKKTDLGAREPDVKEQSSEKLQHDCRKREK